MASMLAYFDVIAPHLPLALVSEAAAAHVRALAGVLPPCDLAGFECRLGEDDPAVDFTVRVPSGAFLVPPLFRAHPVWRGVEELCAKVIDRSSPLAGRVNVLDLEFDLPFDDVPVPSIFFDLQRSRPFAGEEIVALASEVAGRIPSAGAERALHRLVDALPSPGRIIHIGAMRARRSDAWRAVVSRVPPPELPGYLDAIGWRGDRAVVAAAIAQLAPLAGTLAVSLDVGDGLGARVGIETFIEPVDRDRKWRALLGWLVANDACTAEKARAAMEWGGVSKPEEGRWPESLSWADRLMRGRGASLFSRFLSHLKVVVDEKPPLRAKAYFGFSHTWAQPSSVVVESRA